MEYGRTGVSFGRQAIARAVTRIRDARYAAIATSSSGDSSHESVAGHRRLESAHRRDVALRINRQIICVDATLPVVTDRSE